MLILVLLINVNLVNKSKYLQTTITLNKKVLTKVLNIIYNNSDQLIGGAHREKRNFSTK